MDPEKLLKLFNTQPIGKEDYALKNANFRTWLFEEKRKYFDKLSTKKAKKIFKKKFVGLWNAGQLPEKIYKSRSLQAFEAAERTGFTWSFEKNLTKGEKMQLQLARDSVNANTNEEKVAKRIGIEFEKINEQKIKKRERWLAKQKDFASKEVKEHETKSKARETRAERLKRLRAARKVAEEEIAPKKEGFARRVEKRQSKHSFKNEFHEPDIFDNNEDQGLSFLKRDRDQKKRERYKRKDDYMKKEESTMKRFKKFM